MLTNRYFVGDVNCKMPQLAAITNRKWIVEAFVTIDLRALLLH